MASTTSYIGTALVVLAVGRIVYLRYFHPLAHVPGPFWASVSELYRFYYDFIQNGTYYRQFEGYQARYGPYLLFPYHHSLPNFDPAHKGPVVRIAPNEVLL